MNATLADSLCFFFFNDTATTEIYTLSLHDALPICDARPVRAHQHHCAALCARLREILWRRGDRKSTRLNSRHQIISYAVFCLKKKRKRASPFHGPQRETPPRTQAAHTPTSQ